MTEAALESTGSLRNCLGTYVFWTHTPGFGPKALLPRMRYPFLDADLLEVALHLPAALQPGRQEGQQDEPFLARHPVRAVLNQGGASGALLWCTVICTGVLYMFTYIPAHVCAYT